MDETNEDSWLYGTSNPDSTTNEPQGDGNVAANAENRIGSLLKSDAENEAQALAAVQNASGDIIVETKEEPMTHDEYEDPAHEMEEDEDATAATAADTTDAHGSNVGDDGDEDKDAEGAETQQEKSATGSDDDDDDSDDDDINVVIGDIKAAPSSYNIKQRGNLLAAGQAGQDKSKGTSQGGKFSMEDFEGVGTINGVAAHEFSIDSLEDKPWRKPGADITDYFNYGFNEETWRAYCERQKRFRVSESGVGLASLTQNLNQADRHAGDHGGVGLLPPPGSMLPPNAMMNDPMQGGPMSGMMPPPMGAHHHGGPLQRLPMRPRQLSTLGNAGNTSKENAIQVMTAECREYSRPGQMASNFSGPPPSEEPFFHEPETFDYGYEPTQESQWGNNDNSGWVPTGIKELTPGPTLVTPPIAVSQSGPPPGAMPPGPPMTGLPPPIRGPPPSIIGNMPPNMGMGPPPHVMMMGGAPMNMPPMGPRMMPPQISGPGAPPPMAPNQSRSDDRVRSPSRRNRSRSPQRSRRRSKTPSSQRQRRSRSRSKSRKQKSRSRSKPRKPRPSRRSSSKSRRSTSKSRNSRKNSSRTQRSPSESKSRSKLSRKSHSRSRTKSPKANLLSSSTKKRTEKSQK